MRISPVSRQSPLWQCPRCEREFANRNQAHSCGRYELEPLFRGAMPEVRELFDLVAEEIRALGPVKILPEKTRIAFQARMSFAQVTPRRRWLDGHVVLARRFEHPRFRKVETISPRNHVHYFRLESASDIDADFREWIREAYEVGEQRHLERGKEHGRGVK